MNRFLALGSSISHNSEYLLLHRIHVPLVVLALTAYNITQVGYDIAQVEPSIRLYSNNKISVWGIWEVIWPYFMLIIKYLVFQIAIFSTCFMALKSFCHKSLLKPPGAQWLLFSWDADWWVFRQWLSKWQILETLADSWNTVDSGPVYQQWSDWTRRGYIHASVNTWNYFQSVITNMK